MRPTACARRLLTVGAIAVTVFTGPAAVGPPPVAASPAAASPTVTVAGTGYGAYARLLPLVDLSSRRLATADLVAAAKWGTLSPVDDPVREGQVLDAAARQAREAGGDPKATAGVFRDRIEANKRVQRALHSRWDADPSDAPVGRPDLAEVREEINRANVDLVRAIVASPAARAAHFCGGTLTAAEAHVRHDRRLDPLHATALRHALRSVCVERTGRPSN
ncbi:gamma subclass chorismate mutase AroQ [Streptomyces sp. NPDC052179]|uniref:gamma subclass chorismate mutase AroQ n=1 Tax=Streptomyces sp. NPDC052179 TaxID=3155680 RepID=UPI0034354345